MDEKKPLDVSDPSGRLKSTYNKEKYEQNKEKILGYRKNRYRELNT